MPRSKFADLIARTAAQRASVAAATRIEAPKQAPKRSKTLVLDFSHLRPAARQAAQPAPTRTERGREFAAEMERVSAQVEGRKPRALVDGPQQGRVRVTGAELAAAARQRNEERERAVLVRRSGLMGG